MSTMIKQEKLEICERTEKKLAMSNMTREEKLNAVVKLMEDGKAEAVIMQFVQMNIRAAINGIKFFKEALDKANAGVELNGDGFEAYVYHNEILEQYDKELREIWDPDDHTDLREMLSSWNSDITGTGDIFDRALEKSMDRIVELNTPTKKAPVLDFVKFKSKKVVNN